MRTTIFVCVVAANKNATTTVMEKRAPTTQEGDHVAYIYTPRICTIMYMNNTYMGMPSIRQEGTYWI
jgi:hypothetical protein